MAAICGLTTKQSRMPGVANGVGERYPSRRINSGMLLLSV